MFEHTKIYKRESEPRKNVKKQVSIDLQSYIPFFSLFLYEIHYSVLHTTYRRNRTFPNPMGKHIFNVEEKKKRIK